ncbi:AAA family ATPase [Wenyingzhuangia sp. 1_MG-2023]|nr:AAA family ATPase [Wenyingzhuangia sp. 1_MG-2023]
MKLEKITIENYKSIDELEFEITKINESYTYSLIGVNESGKSSFLKAVSLLDDNENINYPQDYFNDNIPIEITYTYTLDDLDLKSLKNKLKTTHNFDNNLLKEIKINKVDIKLKFESNITPTKTETETIHFENTIFDNYTVSNDLISKKEPTDEAKEDLNLNSFFEKHLDEYFWENSHHSVFWKSSPEYLILEEIDLVSFSKTPKEISIPLLNCFILIGIKEDDIEKEIEKLNSPVAINSLQNKLSELITKHINFVWPEHPISITFQINNNKISLLIEDNGVKYQPKTAGQRSDGFRQFISFLLTISVESYNKELSNTILLIDEPETHLHPPAQINLLKELIKITSNNNNNILFFATHSNYLIDKTNLERNFKVYKENNQRTKIEQIEKKKSSYSEVNYEVFNICTSDYHNELYGAIEFENKEILDNLKKTKKWINAKTKKERDVSLSEYVRHSIHHPENELNKKVTEKDLNESIISLRKLKESIK